MADSSEQLEMAHTQIREWAEALAKTYEMTPEELLASVEKSNGKFEDFQLHYDFNQRLERYYWRLQDHGSASYRYRQQHGTLTRAAKFIEQTPGYKICGRCGGVGQSQAWRRTGKVCYECHGRGVVREHVIQI